MSRVGKQPIAIPSGISVEIDGTKVIVKKGNKTTEVDTLGNVNMKIENSELVFELKADDKQSRAFWGTYRALVNNTIVGLATGFEKKLEINGVGYRAAVKGSVLELQLGYSHPINFEIPSGIEIVVEKNTVLIKGSDKQEVGQVAADIRGFRPPEPYKGKGIKYSDETIIRKAGKTSKK
jgi:large subunit ribosomal protein L6